MGKITEIATIEAPKALGPYSQGIVTGELLFISGQIGLIPQTGELVDPLAWRNFFLRYFDILPNHPC